ncbi:NUMOD4 motif [Bacteroidales bacterium Barb4]|nr:NUMOD4 motif [Bacteroidales bacterium Barb4]
MKKIEEEWKVIPEAPEYEISNLGRCRNIKRNKVIKERVLKIGSSYRAFYYRLHIKGNIFTRTVGKLVAQTFVPNPNGCTQIRYKDGDISNAFFMNIKWVKNKDLPPFVNRTKTFSRECQLEAIREHMRRLSELEKAVQNDAIVEFLHWEVVPIYREKIKAKIKDDELRKECLSWMIDYLEDYLNRGWAAASFDSFLQPLIWKFFRLRQKYTTIEFNPDYFNHNNQEDTEDDQ